jgi:hypothetical protein
MMNSGLFMLFLAFFTSFLLKGSFFLQQCKEAIFFLTGSFLLIPLRFVQQGSC